MVFLNYRIILVMSLFIPLSACVEVRDKKKEADPAVVEVPEIPPMVKPQHISRLVLDGPAYVYQGRILTQKEMESERAKNKNGITRDVRDLEFNFNEVILKKGAVLYTLGNRVRLKVDQFESDDATISTFPKTTTAPQGMEGRDGGHVLLSFKNAKGYLTVVMRGENGGQGKEGPAPDDKLKGEKGAAGTPTQCSSANNKYGKNGEPGGQGLRGYPGKAGSRGGSSGTLDLVIHEGNEFFHKIERAAGSGGLGGQGGRGGPGGEGGDAGGKKGHSFVCIGTKKGGVGPEGEPGPSGDKGADGVIGTVCVTRNQNMTCY